MSSKALPLRGVALGHLSLVRGKGTQNLLLLLVRNPEMVERSRKLGGDLVTYVERVSGVGPEEISRFFAAGMLWNVVAAMDLEHSGEEWAARLIAGCGKG